MKILHVVPTYLPATRYGGPIYSVHGLCAGLAANNETVSVYTTSVNGNQNSDVEHGRAYIKNNVEIFYFKSSFLRRIYYSPQLQRALEQSINTFDLLHLHSIFLFPTNIAARIAMRNHIPYVLSPRGMLEKKLISSKSSHVKRTWLTLFEKKTIENAGLIHLTSERELQELSRFDYAFPDTVIIPNGVDSVVKDNDGQKRLSDRFQLLYIGRLNWKKQIDKIIAALTHINFNVHLTIAGNDEDDYQSVLENLIDDLKLNSTENVTINFIGEVNNIEKKQLYLNADVMLLTSKSENFGNTVIEAMAMGCPVIVTPQVGASKIVADAQAGLITQANAQAIAKCITQIKTNPQLARTMSENGVNEIRENYLWQKIAYRMSAAYQRLVTANA